MATPNPEPPQKALALLLPLQPILSGFKHRNKNQHRLSRWWGSLGMLIRNLNKLVNELTSRASQKPISSKKRKRSSEPDGSNDSGSAAEVRARWLLDVLMPKMYLAFSQLTADNQFATLGLVLLGVLAQVNVACNCLVGAVLPTADAAACSNSAAAAAQVRISTAPPVVDSAETTVGEAVDLGQVVSREDFIQVAMLREAGAAGKSKGERRKQASGGNMAVLKKVHARASVGVSDTKEKPTKKKKAKKGDEFDDLFDSLF